MINQFATRYGVLASTMIALGLLATPAQAEDDPNDPNQARGHLTAGIGIASVPSYIGSDRNVIVPTVAAQGSVAGRAFQLQGTSLFVDLVPHRAETGVKFQIGPIASLRLDRTGSIRDTAVEKLGKRKHAIELGGWMGVQKTGVFTSPYDTLGASLSYQRDVAGAHGSYIISPEIDYATPLSHRLYVSLSASADYVGKRFGAYYYDIDRGGSTASGLPVYGDADRAGWKDWNASVLVARSITGDLTHGFKVFGTVAYARMLGRYERSPVVAVAGRSSQLSYALGLGYTF